MADTVYKLTHTGEQIDSAIDNAVRSDAQILTSEQQTQARTNIGAASAASAASAADLTTETNERITADTGVRGLTATVEATSTASKAYAIGAYFVYNGLLYKCTAEIAQGGTITPGTNCTATTAGAEISTLNHALVPDYDTGIAITTTTGTFNKDGLLVLITPYNGYVQMQVKTPAGTLIGNSFVCCASNWSSGNSFSIPVKAGYTWESLAVLNGGAAYLYPYVL